MDDSTLQITTYETETCDHEWEDYPGTVVKKWCRKCYMTVFNA